MSRYWMREDAPLSEDLWARIDEMVVGILRKVLVGRRFLDLVVPVGWGIELAPFFGFTQEDGAWVANETTGYIRLVELAEEFVLRAKQLAIAEQTPFGLDLGAAAIAATQLAKQEDRLIVDTLLGAPGRCSAPLGDWNAPGGPFRAIADAIAGMRMAGFDQPIALVLRPEMYARLVSLIDNCRREIELVESLLQGGIYQMTTMEDNQALLVATGAWNVDLVVGQDAVTAWLGNQGLDQRFRVLESLAVRVKLPGAICLLQ